jgi:hypothetical protein
MPAIVSVNPDQAEWVVEDDPSMPRKLELILTDKDEELHRITFEESALRELAMLLRGIQEGWPGALGGH